MSSIIYVGGEKVDSVYNNKNEVRISESYDNEIHNCNNYNNENHGVYTDLYKVNATYNWWGDETEHHHPVLNTCGFGDEVSDNVSFTPWLTSPHGEENIPPVANDDTATTNVNTPVTMDVTANDYDTDGFYREYNHRRLPHYMERYS